MGRKSQGDLKENFDPKKKRRERASSEGNDESQAAKRARAKNAPKDEATGSHKEHEIRKMALPPQFNMMLPKKAIVDRAIDIEVETRMNETVADLYQQTLAEIEAAKASGEESDWRYDYVVCSTSSAKRKIVLKSTGYPIPSFMSLPKNFDPRDQEPYSSFWKLEVEMDLLEKVLINEFGKEKKFRAKYPHRYAPNEPGETESAFITNPITIFKGVLKSIEWRVCYECDKVNQPEVFFADWTGTTDLNELPRFKFTHELIPSKKLRRALNRNSEYGAILCKKSCEDKPCSSALLNRSQKSDRSCDCKIIKKGHGSTTVDDSPVECTNDCKCDPDTCGNRVVQYGRQYRMIVFKDWRKGFTLRAFCDIPKGVYIGEYTGDVLTHCESLQREHKMYYMEMPNVREIDRDDKKLSQKLVIDGKETGNETRFISHSCLPNLRLQTVYVERAGGWYVRMAFVTKRNISFGEELTFDYFPNIRHSATERNFNKIFDDCYCDSKQCKFNSTEDAKTVAARRTEANAQFEADRIKTEKKAEKEGDSWDEVSENDDSAEAKAKRVQKQLQSRSERTAKRNSLKAQEFGWEELEEEKEEEESKGEAEEEESKGEDEAHDEEMEEDTQDEDDEEDAVENAAEENETDDMEEENEGGGNSDGEESAENQSSDVSEVEIEL